MGGMGWDRVEWNILQIELFLHVYDKWVFSKTSLLVLGLWWMIDDCSLKSRSIE
jgi:hypothetical protein